MDGVNQSLAWAMSGPLLHQIVKALWRARVTWFWPVWIAITIAAAAIVAWTVGHAPATKLEKTKNATSDISRTWRQRQSRGAVALLALFLVGYIAMILSGEDFAYSDNDMFTLFTLKGDNLAPPIWNGAGRFFPLGHQEFNLIRHFTSSAAGYHALPIVQLLILCCILLMLEDELSITVRAALATLVLITPSIMISFGGLIFTERNVVFWLACLVLFVKRFEQTQAVAWAAAASVCAQIVIYYKETAFLLVLGFAAGRLILRCRNPDRPGWNYNRLRDAESRLDLCLASLGVLFLLYYRAAMFPNPSMKYANEWRLPTGEALLSYLRMDLLVWLFVVIVLGRAYLILRRRVMPSLLWDGLALGGVACFAAYLRLRMFTAYYLAPVDLIAVLYVGRFAIRSWENARLWGKVTGMILLSVVLLQDVSLSAFSVFERKNLIRAKAEIASVVQARYQGSAGNMPRVFLPFASPYRVMEFAAYLNYRGVPVEGARLEPTGLNNVAVVSRSVVKNGPCVEWRNLRCQAGSSPNPGDLVVVLPDDDASLAQVAPYRDGGDLLFFYEPAPRIPQRLSPTVRRLHIASTPFALTELPDRWLDASVTVWK